MVSIIISAYQPQLYQVLLSNISETIGCPYEILPINNPKKMSVAEAYNKGIKKAKFDILCFCHEDIKFHTKKWGETLIEIFKNHENIGVLGVTGTKQFGSLPIGWWDFNWHANVTYLLQRVHNGAILYNKNFSENAILEEVLVTDGLFLVISKKQGLRFNEDIRGYHGYDISICMESIKAGYKNFVTNSLLIEHFSGGSLNKDWIKTLVFFIKYYNKELIEISYYNKDTAMEALKSTIMRAHKYKLWRIAYYYWLKLLINKPLSKFHGRFIYSIFFQKNIAS